jgi:hypothetical protein
MAFVIITIVCNAPAVGAEVGKNAYARFMGVDAADLHATELFNRWFLQTVQYSCALWLSILILSDPFTMVIFRSKL